jgi:hypothetical protein
MGEMVLPLTLVHDHHLGLGNNLDIEGTFSGGVLGFGDGDG